MLPGPLRLASLGLAGALLLTGCGDDDEPATGGPAPLPSQPAASAPATTGTDAAPAQDEPVPLDATAEQGGVTVRVVGLSRQQVTATAPGETSGPALVVRVRLESAADEAVDLTTVQVTVDVGPERTPATPFTGPPTDVFAPSLAPGDSAEAVLAYGVPDGPLDPVTVAVALTPGQPLLAFSGPVA